MLEKTICALAYYYIFINLLLFLLMAIDKKRAKNDEWRVKEKTLFVLSLLGGAVGGVLGMFLFRHKLRKMMFWFVFLGSGAVHVAVGWFLVGWL